MMQNGFLIAGGAGVASALLAAASIFGGIPGLFIGLFAPLPLMIVALGWHPLLAVFGGSITAAALAFFLRGSAGVSFAVLAMAPAVIMGFLAWRDRDTAPELTGKVTLGLCAVAALATLIGAFSISFDYDVLQQQLLRQSEAVFRYMMKLPSTGPLDPVRGQDPQVFIQAYAQMVAPISTLILGLVYVLNGWVATRAVEASGRMPQPRAPLSDMVFPKAILPFASLAVLGGLMSGYIGFAFELAAVAALLGLTFLGFATMHSLTRGSGARGIILTGLWTLTLVFGLPALFMLGLGIGELVFGWRQRKAAMRNS